MAGFLIFTLLTFAVFQVSDARQNIYVSACNNQYLNLHCPRNHKIAVKRLFYGVYEKSRAKRCENRKVGLGDCCRATQADCREFSDEVYPKLNNRCSGYEKCSIIVESVPIRSAVCQTDQIYTDYMTVIYDCVPVKDIARFCSDDSKRGKVLYLANEEYPKHVSPSSSSSSCNCVASTEFSNGINLYSIDVLVAPDFSSRSCSKGIRITDKHAFEKEITCGHRGWFGFRTVYSRTVNNVSLELQNVHGKGTAFVWLEVKATNSNDFVQIHCGESLHKLLAGVGESGASRRSNEGIIETLQTTTLAYTPGEPASSYGPNSLSSDMAAIVGGIVVAAFLMFTVVIVALAVHCRRLHKERNKPTKVELYPAIPPSQLETSSYRHYDYDDDHYCSISRSPMKVSNFSDCPTGNQTFRELSPPDIVADHDMNGMKPYETTEDQALIHNHQSYLSNTDREISGHKTLPSLNSSINNPFPTQLPPTKRSKSVTFSQPVAKVTPMNPELEDSTQDFYSTADSGYTAPDDDYYEFPPPPPLDTLESNETSMDQTPLNITDIYAVVNKPPKKHIIYDDDKPYDNVAINETPRAPEIPLKKIIHPHHPAPFDSLQRKVETGV